MIVGVLAIGAGMAFIAKAARGATWFRAVLDQVASEKKEVQKRFVRLDLFVNLEEFDRVIANPDVEKALIQGAMLKNFTRAVLKSQNKNKEVS